MEAGEELPQFLEHFVTAMTSLAEPNPCQDHILGIFIWFVSPFFLAVLVVVSLELCCFATRGRTAPGLWRPSLFGKKEKEWRRRILEFCFPEFEIEASKDQPTAYCVICQEACREGEKLRRITCTHTFHSICPVLSSSSSRTYQEYLAMQKKGLRNRVQSATAQPS